MLAEDVTTSTLERLRIERERDYDLLTGLYNRRAFYRFAGRLFDRPDKMKHAAVVMMDLDNLKRTNDTFGHEWGDRYIHEAAVCFLRSIPDARFARAYPATNSTFCSAGTTAARRCSAQSTGLFPVLKTAISTWPDGQATRIHVSGGIAWYPEDGTELMELIKCADFAMYQMKRNEKGRFGVFDRKQYNQTEGDMSR